MDPSANIMPLQTMDGVSYGMGATRQDGYATKADWDRHRDLIARLYQDNHLTDVMRVMKSQHNFKATSVSYSCSGVLLLLAYFA